MSPPPTVAHHLQWQVVEGCHECPATSSLPCKTFQLPHLVGHVDLTPVKEQVLWVCVLYISKVSVCMYINLLTTIFNPAKIDVELTN